MKEIIPTAAGIAIGMTAANPMVARIIQEHYRQIDFTRPIITTINERKYPQGWIHAGTIQQTHPIFYIDMKGNMVFCKPTRMEYYRYIYQRSTLGKLGYHTWMLRGYLSPPKAPESWKKWAAQRIEKIRERLAPEPLPSPAMARARSARRSPWRMGTRRAMRR